MDLTTITIADFKALFFRDFAYLPLWLPSPAFYNTGEEVYYGTTRLFYTAKNNGVTSVPTTAADWTVTPDDVDNFIQDQDITNAFAEATAVFNQSLFGDDTTIKLAYLYLTAHYLVNDIQTSRQGVQSTGRNPVTSRTVGSVSESYAVPERFLADPIVQFYTTTGYGRKFLSMALPAMVGNMASTWGGTNP